MPLLYQERILRRHLQANRDALFVFGDNVKRTGLAGQAAEMRNEPNAIGVATKWSPSMNEGAFFNDRQLEQIEAILLKDLAPVYGALLRNKIVVWPAAGIGTGLSQLPTRAPEVWALLEETRRMFEQL